MIPQHNTLQAYWNRSCNTDHEVEMSTAFETTVKENSTLQPLVIALLKISCHSRMHHIIDSLLVCLTSQEKLGKHRFLQDSLCTSEAATYQKVADELGIRRLSAEGEPLRYARHPLVYMVEAADDICYEIMDIEDSHKLKILSFDETADLLLGFFDETTKNKIRQRIIDEELTDENEQVVYMRACVIGKLENECVKAFLDHEEEILAGTFEGALIDHSSEHERNAYITCTQVSRKKIYASKPVLDIELSGYKIMATLMEVFIDAAVNPSRFYSKQLLRRVSSQYDIENESLEERIMAVLDYISGMTDIYALDIYQKINGISLPIV